MVQSRVSTNDDRVGIEIGERLGHGGMSTDHNQGSCELSATYHPNPSAGITQFRFSGR